MKNIQIFIVSSFFCIGHASISPTNQIPADPYSSLSTDQYVFAGQLSDDKRQIFAHMSSAERKECMLLAGRFSATGRHLSPDEAVAKVASLKDQE